MAEHEDSDLRTGAKAAAAAAAVGAAVGVARAIAARAEEAAHRNGDEPELHEEEPEDRAAPEDRAETDVAYDHDGDDEDEHEEREPVRGTSVDRLRRLTATARELLQELNGADVESISAVDKTQDGWRVTVETVEVRRVPDSMDVMATYDVELDGDGDLVRYERRRRYARAQSDHGDRG